MNITVAGLWHLGSVTAACLAQAGNQVIAYDPDEGIIDGFIRNNPPIFEPKLTDLLLNNTDKITYTSRLEDLASNALIWITFDTPVNAEDQADTVSVMQHVQAIIRHVPKHSLLMVSSQLPVGSIAHLEAYCAANYPEKGLFFAAIPENLRLGKAIDVFTHPDRIVIGLDNMAYKTQLETLLGPFSDNLLWMSIRSAEMAKHAINAFLALSVTFINEIAALCETVGAHARDVERALKSEERIGPKSYLRPGEAIAGGTLLRDIHYLMQVGLAEDRHTFLLAAVLQSNAYHKEWACRKLTSLFTPLHDKKIAVLGLAYKAETDTLRRSAMVETCAWLHQQGARITAYDPHVAVLPDDVAHFIDLQPSIRASLQDVDAIIISTNCPEFEQITPESLMQAHKQTVVLDANGFVAKNIAGDTRIHYYTVGVPV